MYIKTNNKVYPCVGYDSRPWTLSDARFRLTGDALPAELGDTVELYQDDGFLLVTKTVADYARWEVEGHTLVLTNRPVPEPVPAPNPAEPTPPQPTVQDAMLDMLADLDYRVSQQELAAMAAKNSEEG